MAPPWISRLRAVLDAITPATRAVLIANPNNPTGTGLSLPAIERILKRARKAVVFIDEAYFEFSGVTALGQIERSPNLFVSRTFSKVYGMAAMRLGCLFSHPANIAYLHKAQSPYSVNTLAVLAAQAAIRDTRIHRELCGRSAGRARTAVRGSREACRSRYVPSSANFVLVRAGKRAHRNPRLPARAGHPGARPQLRSARLRAHHRGHARANAPAAGRAGERYGSPS